MMGDSGGRSARARVDPEARRRATPRERQHIDPPKDQMIPLYRATPRGEKVKKWLNSAFEYGMAFGVGAFGGAIITVWLFR